MPEHDNYCVGGNRRGFLTPFHAKIYDFPSAYSHTLLIVTFFPRTFGVTITGVDCSYTEIGIYYQLLRRSQSSKSLTLTPHIYHTHPKITVYHHTF